MTANEVRRERGRAAIALHPDNLDKLTAAKDLVADILHAVYDVDPPEGAYTPEAFLQAALWTFQGDAEDDARLASESELPTWTPDEEADPLEPLAVDARRARDAEVVAVDVWAADAEALRPAEGVTIEPLPPAAEYVRLTGTRAAVAAILADQWTDDAAWVAVTMAGAEVLS